jgi:hypothetical protein
MLIATWYHHGGGKEGQKGKNGVLLGDDVLSQRANKLLPCGADATNCI